MIYATIGSESDIRGDLIMHKCINAYNVIENFVC